MLFSTSHLSLAEGKLGSFSEIPELFTKEFTRLIQSFDLTWRDLQISSHCCTPEKEQHKILAARVHADQTAAQAQEGHAIHHMGNYAVPEPNPQWSHQIHFVESDRWDHMINCLIEDMKKLTMGASLVVQWYKNPPCNAGDTGSIPGPGRYHMLRSNEACVLQLLSPPEPQLLKPTRPRARAPHARSHQNEKPLNHIEE